MNAIATRGPEGEVAILVWNGPVDDSKPEGDPLLDRRLELAVAGLPADRYRARHRRVDEDRSNLNRTWEHLRQGTDWPDEAGWDALRASDRLEDLEPEREVEPESGSIRLEFDLPMPAVSLLELSPA